MSTCGLARGGWIWGLLPARRARPALQARKGNAARRARPARRVNAAPKGHEDRQARPAQQVAKALQAHEDRQDPLDRQDRPARPDRQASVALRASKATRGHAAHVAKPARKVLVVLRARPASKARQAHPGRKRSASSNTAPTPTPNEPAAWSGVCGSARKSRSIWPPVTYGSNPNQKEEALWLIRRLSTPGPNA